MRSFAACPGHALTVTSSPRPRRAPVRWRSCASARSTGEAAKVVQLVFGAGGARPAMALAACALWSDPASSLRTVGVTGTNGKTTTTYFLRSVFERQGWPTAVIGTLGGARTTPEAPDLQRRSRTPGTPAAAPWRSRSRSHALVQHRLDGYSHDVAVFTNLSQDHLDYHGTMECLLRGQSRAVHSRARQRAVINADDPFGQRLLRDRRHPGRAFSLWRRRTTSRWASRRAVSASTGTRSGCAPAARSTSRNALAAAALPRALGVPRGHASRPGCRRPSRPSGPLGGGAECVSAPRRRRLRAHPRRARRRSCAARTAKPVEQAG